MNPVFRVRRGGSAALITALFLLAVSACSAQQTVTREVVSGGGGTTGSSRFAVRGTLSQTAVGRLQGGDPDWRHDVGFWYEAYRPEVTTTVTLPAIETNVATRLRVDLTLATATNTPDRPFLPRRFTVRIRFNSSLLYPLDPNLRQNYDGDDCIIEISDTARIENGVIASFEAVTTLGNAESTPLEIESFAWDTRAEEKVGIIRVDGSLKLLDVCREGDELRLVRSGPAARLNIYPNPAKENLTLELTPTASGPLDIRIVNLLGSEVAHIDGGEVEVDRHYTTGIPLDGIPSGTYVVLCRLPDGVLTERLVIHE